MLEPHQVIRLVVYNEILEGCDEPQELLGGRRIRDASDVKELMAAKIQLLRLLDDWHAAN